MTAIYESKELLTVDDVVQRYNINKSTLYQMVSRREVGSVKIGKRIFFRKPDLDTYVAACVREAEAKTKNTGAEEASSRNE